MTKLKSKKLTKSTFAIIIMAIVMVAMIAFGGTYAYFTANTTQDSTKLSTGFLKIRSNNSIHTIGLTNVFPSQQILPAAGIGTSTDGKDEGIVLSVKTNDDNGNYVAIRVKFDVYDYNGKLVTMPFHDADYSGQIDDGEKVEWDANKDGTISSEESAAWASKNWDKNNNGYLESGEGFEAPKMDAEGYKYTVYNDTTSTAVDAQGKPTGKGGAYSETSQTLTTTAPNKTAMGEFDYYHTMLSYNAAMNKYRTHKKIYDAEKSIANMLTSLNADNMILNTTALHFNGDDDSTGYYWRNLKYKGTADTASKVSGVYVCVSTVSDMEPVQIAGNNKLQAVGAGTYEVGAESAEIKLLVNHDEFIIPADITDNWDEGYVDEEDSDDLYNQHSEAGLMKGSIVISFQAVSIQATGLSESDLGGTGFQVAQDKLKELLDSKWEEKNVPGIGTTPDQGTTW